MKSQNTKINFPQLVEGISVCKSWEDWLEQTENSLKKLGYRKYVQSHKREDFAYWKTFDVNDKKAYQVGLLFYDFRKYQEAINVPQRIGVQFECMLIDIDARIDLSVSKAITLHKFEEMSQTFYDAMNKYVR